METDKNWFSVLYFFIWNAFTSEMTVLWLIFLKVDNARMKIVQRNNWENNISSEVEETK